MVLAERASPGAESPHPDALAALAGKYARMAELRRAHLRGEPLPARQVLAALAEQFPGALRELDTLTLEAIDARAAALSAASLGRAEVAPWMLWLRDYHGWMRAALWIKRRVPREALDAERAAALALEARRISGHPVDSHFVAQVARPPGGRLRPLVLERVAAAHPADEPALCAALFPAHAARSE